MTDKTTNCSPTFHPSPTPFLYRAYQLLNGVSPSGALNCTDSIQSASDNLIFELRQAVNAIKLDAFELETGTVNYTKLNKSPAYKAFRQTTKQLQTFPLQSLSTNAERLAFWINLYNVLIMDAVIQFGIENSVQDVRAFFAKAAYIIDGYRFSADDVEHGVLRANAGHPAIPGRQFKRNDPRHQFIMKSIDPRIHFTLVCASKSCPPIGIYNAENLDHQLELAAINFINGGEVEIDVDTKTVEMSKIFQWYALDFGGRVINQLGMGNFSAVLHYIAPYVSDESSKQGLENNPADFKVRFKKYDWGLNLVA
jgi:hypothetical protein